MTTRGRHPGTGPLSRTTAGVLTALGLLAPSLAVQAGAAPIVVGRADVSDGSLRLEPAVQAPQETTAVWTLTNGGEQTITFDLSLHELVVGEDGRAAAGPASNLEPPAGEVTLAAGEQAWIEVDLRDASAVAMQATADDTRPLVAFAVAAAATEVAAAVDFDARTGDVTIVLSSDRPTIANTTVTATSWPSRDLGTTTVGPVVVVPPGVTITASVTGALGPTRVGVGVTAFGGSSTTTRTSGFVVTRFAAAVLAGTALAVAAAAILITIRRRPGLDAPHDPTLSPDPEENP